jgi:leader peptidase (prepilin peptidase)/N-methyltransferase
LSTGLFLFLAAALGAALGSFLGVIIDRDGLLPASGSLLRPARSRCGHCRHQLAWWENIPLISFILLGGKCRNCRSPIPYWLVLIEIVGAASGAAIAAQISQISQIRLIGLIFIAAALIWIFFSDLVKGFIPDWAVALGSAGALIWQIGQISLIRLIFIAAGAAGFFWLLVLATRGRGMGGGDVTLAFFLGLWLGWPKIAVAVWLGFLIGAVWAVGLILLGRKKFGQTVPFGPFFITGAVIAYFYGEKVLSWFL